MKHLFQYIAMVLVVLVAPSCDSGGGGGAGGPGEDTSGADTTHLDVTAPGDWTPAGEPGHVVYRSGDDGHLYRIEAVPGADPEDLSAAMDALSLGEDVWVNASPNGAWLLVGTERFGCDGWACGVRLSEDLSDAEVIAPDGGEPIHPEFSAISDDGTLVVYREETDDGAALFAVHRGPNGWGTPLLLTGDSGFPWNELPSISSSGDTVLFGCGPTPYSQEGTALCEVGTDGSGFRVVLGPKDHAGGTKENSLRSADYADWGGIVFEADWTGEQIWQLPDGGTPSTVAGGFNNDNSPCALPGAVASLWLDRPGGEGYHELKITSPGGDAWFMLVEDVDIMDIGIGCSR